ncbi:hypothetical protein A2U01_0081080, partial [Trifolium medium]|nr:hypothetical protein [Trifolium medium]
HTAIAVRCGCGGYRISNIAAAVANSDRNLKPWSYAQIGIHNLCCHVELLLYVKVLVMYELLFEVNLVRESDFCARRTSSRTAKPQ